MVADWESVMFQFFLKSLIASFVVLTLQASAQEPYSALPDGPGKELVEAVCVACHETDIIYSSTGYTNNEWRNLFSRMIDLPFGLFDD